MKPKQCMLVLLLIGVLLIAFHLYESHVNLVTAVDNLIFDIGNGLAVFSLTILLYLFIHHVVEWKDIHKIYSRKKWLIIVSTNLLWLLLIPGIFSYYALHAMRGDFPSNADSIMIPISGQVTSVLLMLLPINTLLFLSLRKTEHPTRFVVERVKVSEKRPFSLYLWIVLYDILILINCFLIVSFIIEGATVSIIVFLGLLHNLFSLKFGKINSIMLHTDQVT